MQRYVLPLAIVATAVPATLLAQDRAALCGRISRLDLGEWAEYRVAGLPNGMDRMRWANVGTQQVDGVPHFWYEMKITGDANVVSQMLTPDVPSNIGDLKEMVIQVEDQAPLRFSGELLATAAQQTPMASTQVDRECREAELVGTERVSVPAGEFDAFHFRSEAGNGDFWISAEIPFGIVRSVIRGIEMSLAGFGEGAESELIRE